mmetsp:Transcript_90524/g.258956  ORF Transcript_90524/g.258956 Transcript_90524/m.258956 type:complete len:271 (+) Transcript_90524:62-874(+)
MRHAVSRYASRSPAFASCLRACPGSAPSAARSACSGARLEAGLIRRLLGQGTRGGSSCRRAFSTPAAGADPASRCWSCGAEHVGSFSFFCPAPGCGAAMEADYRGTTHFELLGLTPKFALDLAEVDKAYKDLQRKLHPDRHAQAEERQRERVDAHSARVNEAVSTLRSPLLRAGYWMELHGVRVLEEDQRIDDAATMMEVMEVSEEIEEAKSQGAIDRLASDNDAKVSEIEGKLEACFQKEDWEAGRPLLERLQMLTRLRQRMDEWRPPS